MCIRYNFSLKNLFKIGLLGISSSLFLCIKDDDREVVLY